MTPVAALTVLAALVAGGPSLIELRSDSACPSSDAVRAALEALGAEHTTLPPISAAVRSRDDGLIVELASPGEARPQIRELAIGAACEARAEAAAVVIASWLGILPATALAPPRPAAVLTPPPAAVVAVRAPAPFSAAAPRRTWLGVGLGATAGGGVVPGLRLEIARDWSPTFNLGWIAGALVAMPRSKQVATGTSSWIRPALGIGGQASWRTGDLLVGIDLGPLVGMTFAWGDGYPYNQTDQGSTWGLCGGLRLQIAGARSRSWIDVRVVDWLRPQRLRFDALPSGPTTAAALPSVEGLVTLGWSLAP